MAGDNAVDPPLETADLRKNLKAFLRQDFGGRAIGSYRWGVYAFYDYDGEPIYVGQTNEQVSSRIGRHLTNQRTDAVAMSVLDPFEVFEVAVWPLADLQEIRSGHSLFSSARTKLNALEYQVYEDAIRRSQFGAVLNEKAPLAPQFLIELPEPCRGRIVSEALREIRGHPDFRIARRAQTLARLAQVISERQVAAGLRRTLLTQSRRLEWLAHRRLKAVGEAGEPDLE